MTQFSHSADGQRSGNIAATAGWNGGQFGSVNGFPSSNVLYYKSTPATADPDGVSVSASPGAGAILIDGALATSGVATMDVPRALVYVSAGNDSGITFTTTGTDGYGAAQVETITGANAGTAVGIKAFKTVTAVAHTGSVAGALTIGTGDVLGLHARVTVGPALVTHQAGTVIAPDAGTLTVGVTTDPATALTGDTRGLYDPAGALNGANWVILGVYVEDPGDYASIRGVATYGG